MEMAVDELSGKLKRVRLVGRLDAAGADQIDMRLTAAVVATASPTIVDLSEVSFLASMGIRLLIATARGLHMKGAKLALFGASELVQDVLEQVALDQIIPIVADEARAIEVVSA